MKRPESGQPMASIPYPPYSFAVCTPKKAPVSVAAEREERRFGQFIVERDPPMPRMLPR